jgi:ubiquitin-like protein Pup
VADGVSLDTVWDMQERVRRQRDTGPGDETIQIPSSERADTGKLKDELDDILDQIDDVLEENAEEFVRNYVQKGGE